MWPRGLEDGNLRFLAILTILTFGILKFLEIWRKFSIVTFSWGYLVKFVLGRIFWDFGNFGPNDDIWLTDDLSSFWSNFGHFDHFSRFWVRQGHRGLTTWWKNPAKGSSGAWQCLSGPRSGAQGSDFFVILVRGQKFEVRVDFGHWVDFGHFGVRPQSQPRSLRDSG